MSEGMTVEFVYEGHAGAMSLGACFLLLLLSKENKGCGGVAKAEQHFAMSVKIRCVQGKKSRSERQRERKVPYACCASGRNLRQVRRVGQAACNETTTIKDPVISRHRSSIRVYKIIFKQNQQEPLNSGT